MKRKKLNVIIPLVVYPFDIMFSFGETDDELKKAFSKYHLDWDENMKMRGQGRYWMHLETNQSVIRLWNYPETPADYGTLQHEIFHAVTFIMDKIGAKFELSKSDESYAYLIGYLTTQIYKLI